MDIVEALEKRSVLFAMACIALFLLTFGIGYSVCGVLTAYHADKHNWGMDGLGTLLLWPVALYVHIFADEDD